MKRALPIKGAILALAIVITIITGCVKIQDIGPNKPFPEILTGNWIGNAKSVSNAPDGPAWQILNAANTAIYNISADGTMVITQRITGSTSAENATWNISADNKTFTITDQSGNATSYLLTATNKYLLLVEDYGATGYVGDDHKSYQYVQLTFQRQ
jgi:hypothetical protein